MTQPAWQEQAKIDRITGKARQPTRVSVEDAERHVRQVWTQVQIDQAYSAVQNARWDLAAKQREYMLKKGEADLALRKVEDTERAIATYEARLAEMLESVA